MTTLRTRATHLLCAAALLSMPLVPAAQRLDPSPPSAQATPLFRSESELVVAHVTVRDGNGVWVRGLPSSAFQVFENGRPQDISLFATQDEPATIGLIIDVSGSMAANRARLAYTTSRFADTGNAQDEVFAIVVGDAPRPVLPADAPFTSDPQTLRAAIARAQHPGGLTALYDAVSDGLAYLERGTHARRVLVVVSDGIDNASRLTFDQTMQRAMASNAVVYAVGLVDPISRVRDPGHLKRLARATGGEAFFPPDNQAVTGALETVAQEIRQAYVLGFVPHASPHDGTHHRLKVSVAAPDGRRLQVRTRQMYLAGLAGQAGRAGRAGRQGDAP